MRRSALNLPRICAFGAVILAARPAAAGDPMPCADLAGLRIENTNLLSATAVPAGNDFPEHCRVLGYVRPAINFEIRLPAQSRNGRFLMVGCGGFCGAVDSEQTALVHSLNHGRRRGGLPHAGGGDDARGVVRRADQQSGGEAVPRWHPPGLGGVLALLADTSGRRWRPRSRASTSTGTRRDCS